VAKGDFLLTKNNIKFEDKKILTDELPDINPKPNKKLLPFLPIPLSLWIYNSADPKYDSIMSEYMTYPSELRNQKLRDSLFRKYNHPEYVGRNLFKTRFYHSVGEAPVIFDHDRTEKNTEILKNFFVYHGYWDAKVAYKEHLDSARKKAQVDYLISYKDPTFIKDYFYNIPDPKIKAIYEENLSESLIKKGQILNQVNLEKEIKRITDLMQSEGFYKFNSTNRDIFFSADSLKSRKQVPVTLEIHKDSLDKSHYKIATIGNVDLAVVNGKADFWKENTRKIVLRKINFDKMNKQFKTEALWRMITLTPGEKYDQKNLDLTKRNLITPNNFSILYARDSLRNNGKTAPNDSIVDVLYIVKPLPKYELNLATDINFSQIMNWGISPSAGFTSRNIFGGMENLTTSLSGTFGSVASSKNPDQRTIAYEISGQAKLNIPKLLLPVQYYRKLIPKQYSPSSSVILGASVQNNIGLGRIIFNGGLNYDISVNEVVKHSLSLFNTQLSLTQNKDGYYDFFVGDRVIRDNIFALYEPVNPALIAEFRNGQINSDQVSSTIVNDAAFQNSLSGDNLNLMNSFRQSLINKDRQTQDVLISSLIYNFTYNETARKDLINPFYFSSKFEIAGNIFSLFKHREIQNGVVSDAARTIFNIPYSQFVKFDFDVRKYFNLSNNKTLIFRQFIGLGIPYGNSQNMPFISSYFNGGSMDIRAWKPFGGLGPADSQLDERIRAYAMDNVKLTTNIEYRVPLTNMFEGALFADMGNIWSLKDSGFGDEFKFNKFLKQMGIGTGFGIRIKISYIIARVDFGYEVYNPNYPEGDRWVIQKFQPFKPVANIAFGYPF
jgi:hypothetical protein